MMITAPSNNEENKGMCESNFQWLSVALTDTFNNPVLISM